MRRVGRLRGEPRCSGCVLAAREKSTADASSGAAPEGAAMQRVCPGRSGEINSQCVERVGSGGSRDAAGVSWPLGRTSLCEPRYRGTSMCRCQDTPAASRLRALWRRGFVWGRGVATCGCDCRSRACPRPGDGRVAGSPGRQQAVLLQLRAGRCSGEPHQRMLRRPRHGTPSPQRSRRTPYSGSPGQAAHGCAAAASAHRDVRPSGDLETRSAAAPTEATL